MTDVIWELRPEVLEVNVMFCIWSLGAFLLSNALSAQGWLIGTELVYAVVLYGEGKTRGVMRVCVCTRFGVQADEEVEVEIISGSPTLSRQPVLLQRGYV